MLKAQTMSQVIKNSKFLNVTNCSIKQLPFESYRCENANWTWIDIIAVKQP